MKGTEKKDVAMIEVSLARPCILIVDDDERFLEGAREFFSSQGYEVDTARTPDEAAQILKESGDVKYQLIAVDINFGDLSKTRGDEFVLQNKSLFGGAKIVAFTGAGWSSSPRRKELQKEGVSLLEKSPGLTKILELITQEESQKRVSDIALRVEELVGQHVAVKVVPAATVPMPSDMLMEELKLILVNWLRSRSDPEEPILYYGKRVYSANDMAEEVPNETEVGFAHVQMLVSEFKHSLGID